MLFSLEVRRARKGDCLLLHYGERGDSKLILIDGGPRGVYKSHLRPRIGELRQARHLQATDPLRIDAVMVSHVDDDHIQGILELTGDLLVAQREHKPQAVQILDLWHNSFGDIIGHGGEKLTASVEAQFGAAAVSGSGEFSDDQMSEVESEYAAKHSHVDDDEAKELVASTLKVLASVGQGYQLRVNAEALGIEPNAEFDGKLIIASKDSKPTCMGKGLTFAVVGPMQPEIDALHKKHTSWLKDLERHGKPLPQALAAYVDKSVANLSSIVVLARVENKSILLTGDARGDKILQGLELTGAIEQGGKLKVDILKVPHHGSDNNLDDDFFKRIVADHYVFSGDGEHGNPERATMEMLFGARGDDDYTVHLTYPIDELDEGRKADWEKEQNKERKKKKKKPSQQVRPDWSPAKNALRSFFDAHAGLEEKVRIVDAKKRHVIDLLDPL